MTVCLIFLLSFNISLQNETSSLIKQVFKSYRNESLTGILLTASLKNKYIINEITVNICNKIVKSVIFTIVIALLASLVNKN